jgi:FkbM family methyltransferase
VVLVEDVRILQLVKPRLPQQPVILDVGASDGRWTRQFLQLFPAATAFLFEPGTAYADRMQATLNSHKRLKLFPIALGDRNGPAVFHVLPNPYGSTTVDWDGTGGKLTIVPMRTIDSLIDEGAITQPDLIKMDIQAGELAALRGAIATLPNVRALCLETWIMKGYGAATPLVADLMEFLRPFQFNLFDVGMQYRYDDGTLYAIDTWFVNEALVKSKVRKSWLNFRLR